MGTTARERATEIGGDPRWSAILARDPAADGAFLYSVRTTGVYCRPSCASRRPRPENVAFHASPGEAERAGFRPCRRCRPRGASPAAARTATVAALCRLLEGSDGPTPAEDLAARAGWSVSRMHRVFREVTGLTPRAYAAARRAERVRAALAGGGTITAAFHGAGYGSSGRFYEAAPGALGMTPTEVRRGGAGTEIRFACGPSSLGTVLVAATDRGVCAILLGEDEAVLAADLAGRFPRARLDRAGGAFERVVASVTALVEEPRRALDLPLDIRGTAFQRRVWEALRAVAPGTTATYASIAAALGTPSAARAVASACAANPLAVAVPCHRVLRADGGLAGYRWGVGRKRALLEREGAADGIGGGFPGRLPSYHGRPECRPSVPTTPPA